MIFVDIPSRQKVTINIIQMVDKLYWNLYSFEKSCNAWWIHRLSRAFWDRNYYLLWKIAHNSTSRNIWWNIYIIYFHRSLQPVFFSLYQRSGVSVAQSLTFRTALSRMPSSRPGLEKSEKYFHQTNWRENNSTLNAFVSTLEHSVALGWRDSAALGWCSKHWQLVGHCVIATAVLVTSD